MAACHAVFSTHELIETVLTQLTPFELGTAILVCKTWRKVITNSTRLSNINVLVPGEHGDEPNFFDDDIVYGKDALPTFNPAMPNAICISSPGSASPYRTPGGDLSIAALHFTVKFYKKDPYVWRVTCQPGESPPKPEEEILSVLKGAGPCDFAIMPPLESMKLESSNRKSGSRSRKKVVILRAKGGIRMWHLDEMVRKLSKSKKGKRNVSAHLSIRLLDLPEERFEGV